MKKYKTDFSKEELHAALHANDNEAIAIIEDAGRWTKFIEKFEAFAAFAGGCRNYRRKADKRRQGFRFRSVLGVEGV